MNKLFKDKRYFINTLVLAVAWATSAYSFYFTEFYMKYVPVRSIYVLAMLMGVSDLVATLLFKVFLKIPGVTTKRILVFGCCCLTISAIMLSITLWAVPKEDIHNGM